MKQIVTVVLILTVVLCLAACTKEESKTSYSGPVETVTVTKKQRGDITEMTVSTQTGNTIYKVGERLLPEELGVPIYPGAEMAEMGSWSMAWADGDSSQVLSATTLYSKDPIDKIVSFYQKKFKNDAPQTFDLDMPTGKMVNIILDQADDTTVSVVLLENLNQGGTNIQIAKTKE